jgi:Anti-sigma-K factor rskA
VPASISNPSENHATVGVPRLWRYAGLLASGLALALVLLAALYVRSLWIEHRREVAALDSLNGQIAAARLRLAEHRREVADLAASPDAQTLVAILAAPGAQRVLLKPLPSAPAMAHAAGFLVLSRHPDRAQIDLKGLPPAPPAQTYQLWWRVPHRPPQMAALFHPERNGSSSVTPLSVPGDPTPALELTLEPGSGSVQPTTPPLMITIPPALAKRSR